MPSVGIPQQNRDMIQLVRERRARGFATGLAAVKNKPSEWLMFWGFESEKRVKVRGHGRLIARQLLTNPRRLLDRKKVMCRKFFLANHIIIEEQRGET